MIAIADNNPRHYVYDDLTVYIGEKRVIEVYRNPHWLAPHPTPFEEDLREFKSEVQRRPDQLFAWTREALRFRRREERRSRFVDPSQWEGGFRVRGRACGSSWRVTLR